MRILFKQSFRILLKYRLYTGFALLGLGVAITSLWFISDYVNKMQSFDKFHEGHSNIYRLSLQIAAGGSVDNFATTGIPLGQHLKENYTGIEEYATLTPISVIIKRKEEVYRESGIYSANPETLNVFTFDFLHGNEGAISLPNSILVTESLAKKHFGRSDIMGEELNLNNEIYTVRGVVRDWPENSHLELTAITSREAETSFDLQSWFNIENYTYVKVSDGLGKAEVDAKLDLIVEKVIAPELEGADVEVGFHSQALTDVYFSPGLIDDVKKGSLTYMYLLMLAGALVAIISCLNFVNLTLTLSAQRRAEVQIKRILGITKSYLQVQTAVEALIMAVMVAGFAAILVVIFNKLYFENTSFNSLKSFTNWPVVALSILFVVLIAVIASPYSKGLSGSTRAVLQGETAGTRFFKRLVLGLQFCIAGLVIILTLTLEKQWDFIKKNDLGFDRNGIIVLGLPDYEAIPDNGISFRDRIVELASVSSASLIGGGALPGEENGKDIFEVLDNGSRTERVYNIYRIDENYLEVLNIPLAEGRNFESASGDLKSGIIVNETLVKSEGWSDPLGKSIWYMDEERKVVGVVRNFYNKSLHNAIEPVAFIYETAGANSLLLADSSRDLSSIRNIWDEFYPETPFTATYFDEFINAMYVSEKQLTSLFRFFSITALILCSIGLYALFSLHVLQRTKELSIRKVLGATSLNLIYQVLKQYGSIVAISIIVAVPLAWYMIQAWNAKNPLLSGVSYGVYMVSGIIVLLTSILVVGFHVLKVIRVNPAETLKSND